MSKTNRKRGEEQALSKNHGNKLRYRIRKQEEKEAEKERKEGLEKFLDPHRDIGLGSFDHDEF